MYQIKNRNSKGELHVFMRRSDCGLFVVTKFIGERMVSCFRTIDYLAANADYTSDYIYHDVNN